MRRVAVVGAGIVGASVALHLARAGLAVTVLDRTLPGSGATRSSFAWIGDDGDGHDGPAAALDDAAAREWHRLEEELPGVRVRWSGALCWSDDPSEDETRGRGTRGAAIVHRADIAALEPNLRRPPERAVHFPRDGALDPGTVTAALLRAARGSGAREVRASAVALRSRGNRLAGVETSRGFLPADDVVLAAGVGVPALCSDLGEDLPVEASPALLARFRAPPGLVRTLVATSRAELRCTGGGALVAALGPEGENAPEQLREAGRRTRSWIASTFAGADGVPLTGVEVGIRPIPVDGIPIVGRLAAPPEPYVVVLHPGVQLAPVVGRLVAEEIARGTEAGELRNCRPTRFRSGSRGSVQLGDGG